MLEIKKNIEENVEVLNIFKNTLSSSDEKSIVNLYNSKIYSLEKISEQNNKNIEYLKFQIKNYFTEYDENSEEIKENVSNNTSSIKKINTMITKMNEDINSISDKLDTQIISLEEKFVIDKKHDNNIILNTNDTTILKYNVVLVESKVDKTVLPYYIYEIKSTHGYQNVFMKLLVNIL